MWDVNESFKEPGGRGGAGMLDPYAGSGDSQKALLYYLLRVPAYEQKYLAYMHDIAENWLSWEKLGPEIQRIQALLKDDIAAEIAAITRGRTDIGAVVSFTGLCRGGEGDQAIAAMT